MKKLLLIFNPFSGKAQIKNKLLEIISIFVRSGFCVEVYPTQKGGDVSKVISERGKDFERIVISGGDGTLNEGVNGLVSIEKKDRPVIGYIPAGTTNDFASNLKIPSNMIKAAQLAVNGEKFSCDIGCFNDKRFLYVAAFGAFTNISYETPQMNKNYLGQLAYFLEGIKSLHNLKSYKLKVEADGVVYSGEYIFGMASNSNYVAGIKTRSKLHAALNDGLFEVILIKYPKSIIDFQVTISDLLTQNFNSEQFVMFRTSKAKFSFENEVSWTIDGEFGGNVSSADICLESGGVDFLSGLKNENN